MNIKELFNIVGVMVMSATAMTVAGEHPFVTMITLLTTVFLIVNGIPGIWDLPDDLPNSGSCEKHNQCGSCCICGVTRQFFAYDPVGNSWCWNCVDNWEEKNNKDWASDYSGSSPEKDSK